MNFQLPTEQWNLIIGIVTLLITSTTMYFFLRARKDFCQIVLKLGTAYGYYQDSGGFKIRHEVPGINIFIFNKGKNPLYVADVYLFNKKNNEKFHCPFDTIPDKTEAIGHQSKFTGVFSFSVDSMRRAHTSIPVITIINALKIQEEEKVTLYVRVELENRKFFQSKSLTIQINELVLQLAEEQ